MSFFWGLQISCQTSYFFEVALEGVSPKEFGVGDWVPSLLENDAFKALLKEVGVCRYRRKLNKLIIPLIQFLFPMCVVDEAFVAVIYFGLIGVEGD
jgi:hypothetical protein